MAPLPGVLLSLEFLSPPSISAQLDPDIPWGQPVTLVCRGPAGTNTFRLGKQYNMYSCTDSTNEQWNYTDLTYNVSRCDPGKTEAWFLILAVNRNSVGFYRCLYHRGVRWSERSDPLELVQLDPDLSSQSSRCKSQSRLNPRLQTLYQFSNQFFSSETVEGLQQLSISPWWTQRLLVDNLVTVDGALMLGRNRASPTTAAGGPQEVTYTQLDHCILTQRPPGRTVNRRGYW
ncbi:leukocyte-associated immunoglobulin-like receptor 1 [Sorex fumeus]|uniref:leukocyte-associated immunoglobulin-like receptor 1 n=1 Tax=Sorex fumeus TaxID=62283 RepID=UPI0024AD2FC4|nr:leukocyte-associated immunoglobulin-like receptor 1 [Sorex fumeus]